MEQPGKLAILFIQIPNFDLGVCQKRVRTSERAASGLLCHLGEKVPYLGVTDGSGLAARGAQEIVTFGMESETCHGVLLSQMTCVRGI